MQFIFGVQSTPSVAPSTISASSGTWDWSVIACHCRNRCHVVYPVFGIDKLGIAVAIGVVQVRLMAASATEIGWFSLVRSDKPSKQLHFERNLPIPTKPIPCWQAATQNSLRTAELEVVQRQFLWVKQSGVVSFTVNFALVHQTAHITFDIFARLKEDDSNILQVF